MNKLTEWKRTAHAWWDDNREVAYAGGVIVGILVVIFALGVWVGS